MYGLQFQLRNVLRSIGCLWLVLFSIVACAVDSGASVQVPREALIKVGVSPSPSLVPQSAYPRCEIVLENQAELHKAPDTSMAWVQVMQRGTAFFWLDAGGAWMLAFMNQGWHVKGNTFSLVGKCIDEETKVVYDVYFGRYPIVRS